MLSVRGETNVRHVLVQQVDSYFQLNDTSRFVSLAELVDHYCSHPLLAKGADDHEMVQLVRSPLRAPVRAAEPDSAV